MLFGTRQSFTLANRDQHAAGAVGSLPAGCHGAEVRLLLPFERAASRSRVD